jgi:peptidoglycan hydrolase-like protein with peptidoglycan-binding domain
MKRTTLFIALASAVSIPLSAYAHGNNASSQNESEWSKSTQRVESMNDQQGQSSDLVKQVQEKLSALGKDVGTPDGQMNSKTEQALTDFQQQNGLQATGQLDQQTIAALDLDQSGSAATGGSASRSQGSYAAPKPSDSD